MKKFLRILPILWFIVGLVFAGLCFYGYSLLKTTDNDISMTHQIQPKKETKEATEELNDQANFDPESIKPVSPSEYAKAQLNYEKIVNQWGIGAIYIPSANIRTKILAGMSNQNLMVGVGTYYPDQALGKGNYVLLAHNLVEGGGALGRISNTQLSGVIYATDFTNVYEYFATKNEVVNQANGEVLDLPNEEEKAKITFIRCEGGMNTPNRAVVQGEYGKSYPAEEATPEVKEALGLYKKVDTGTNATTETTDNQQANSNLKNSNNKKNQFKEGKQTRYNGFQRFCIVCFQLINDWFIQLIASYGVIFLFLVVFSNWTLKRMNS